jgi:hypothetical protein
LLAKRVFLAWFASRGTIDVERRWHPVRIVKPIMIDQQLFTRQLKRWPMGLSRAYITSRRVSKHCRCTGERNPGVSNK